MYKITITISTSETFSFMSQSDSFASELFVVGNKIVLFNTNKTFIFDLIEYQDVEPITKEPCRKDEIIEYKINNERKILSKHKFIWVIFIDYKERENDSKTIQSCINDYILRDSNEISNVYLDILCKLVDPLDLIKNQIIFISYGVAARCRIIKSTVVDEKKEGKRVCRFVRDKQNVETASGSIREKKNVKTITKSVRYTKNEKTAYKPVYDKKNVETVSRLFMDFNHNAIRYIMEKASTISLVNIRFTEEYQKVGSVVFFEKMGELIYYFQCVCCRNTNHTVKHDVDYDTRVTLSKQNNKKIKTDKNENENV